MLNPLQLLPSNHPTLRLIAAPVTDFDDELVKLTGEMIYTMRDHQGCGLSAPQVGKSIQLIVVERAGFLEIMVNPFIVSFTKHTYWSVEGCLSVDRDKWGPPAIRRHKTIIVEYQNLKREIFRRKFKNQLAAIVQHEIDHLNGILFTDYWVNK